MPVSTAATNVASRISLRVGEKVLHRLQRVRPVGDHRPDPTPLHTAGEAVTERSRDDNIDAIKRMRSVPMELVHRHILWHIQAVDFHRIAGRIGLVDKKPPRPSRVRRNRAKVLAGDGDLHRLAPFRLYSESP